jgi:predicted acyl esterase
VYLLEELPDGSIRYITEGNLRLIHRKLANEATRPYVDCVPYHSFLREDAAPMVPNKPEKVVLDLLPVSYLVKQGHKLVIAVSCVDRDHFEILDKPDDKIRIYYTGQMPSGVVLPVMK